METLHCILPKINKRPHWNKHPPWNFARKLISVHHLIRASTLEIFSENNKRPWTFIRQGRVLTNDTAVPPWAKLLINCVRNLVNRSESAGLSERVEKLEIVTKTEMDELKTENHKGIPWYSQPPLASHPWYSQPPQTSKSGNISYIGNNMVNPLPYHCGHYI